jgi:hypothetical protein
MHDDDAIDPSEPEPEAADEELERVRALILQRRNRFIAAAMASIGATSDSAACSRVCLSLAMQASDSGAGAPPIGGGQAPAAGSGGSFAAAGSGRATAAAGSGWVIPVSTAGSGGACEVGAAGAGGQGPRAGSAGSAGAAGSLPIEPCSTNQPPPRVCLSAYAPPPDELVDAGLPDSGNEP